MKPINHLSVSIITGVVTFLVTKAILPSISCFFAGWLVDVDHVWDFYKNGGKRFSIKRFEDAVENRKMKKIYLYFHSYELLLILIILCFATHFNYFLSFTTLGFAVHLIFDQIFNLVNPFTYFFTYRILNGYRADILIKIKPHEPSLTVVEQEN